MCDHPASTLVDGNDLHIPEGEGEAFITDISASGDVTADGHPELAVVVYCNAGGVSWPEWVVVYTTGGELLGGVDLGSLTAFAQRASVDTLQYSDQGFDVQWLTSREDDPGCCPTLDASARLVVDHANRVAATNVQTFDEGSLLTALTEARGDPARVAGLYSPDADTTSAAALASLIPSYAFDVTCYGELSGHDSDFGSGGRECIGPGFALSLDHLGFNMWRIADVKITATDTTSTVAPVAPGPPSLDEVQQIIQQFLLAGGAGRLDSAWGLFGTTERRLPQWNAGADITSPPQAFVDFWSGVRVVGPARPVLQDLTPPGAADRTVRTVLAWTHVDGETTHEVTDFVVGREPEKGGLAINQWTFVCMLGSSQCP